MKVSVGRLIIVLGAHIVLMYSPNCIIQQAAESMRGGGLDINKSATISKIVFLFIYVTAETILSGKSQLCYYRLVFTNLKL